jgi:hypothetical protein
VITVVPAASGGSMLRADAQVTWYPPRTFAEYIDPDYYHALTITATIYGRGVHTVHAVVTSRSAIARLAEALDRSPAWPPGIVSCPGRPGELPAGVLGIGKPPPGRRGLRGAVVVRGHGITVAGVSQPSLADGGAVAALAGQALHLASRR